MEYQANSLFIYAKLLHIFRQTAHAVDHIVLHKFACIVIAVSDSIRTTHLGLPSSQDYLRK